jgi:hypothetical protein
MLNNKDYLRIILSEYAPIDVSLIVNELFPSVSKAEYYFYIGSGVHCCASLRNGTIPD